MRRVRAGRSEVRRLALLTTFAFAALLPIAGPATAAVPAPGWTINSFAGPTHFSAADTALPRCAEGTHVGCDHYTVTATNAGSKPTSAAPITLKDTLPAGLSVKAVSLFRSSSAQENLGSDCTLAAPTVSCKFTQGPLAADESLQLFVFFTVDEGAPAGPIANSAEVSGGGAPAAATAEQNEISATPPPFGAGAFTNFLAGLDGASEAQAGAHPYEQTTTIGLANELRTGTGPTSVEDPRDILVDLPPGLAGSALSAPKCKLSELASNQHCPADTRVGYIATEPTGHTDEAASPLWNVVPEHGVLAEFGYVDATNASHVLYVSLAPSAEGYVLRTTGAEIPQILLDRIIVNVYGDPAARAGAREQQAKDVPTFTNPADCNGKPLLTHVYLDSWHNPGARNPDGSPDLSGGGWASATSVATNSLGEPITITGCNQLQFHPTIEAKPETNRGDTPTGLEVTLKVPQSEGVGALGTPPLKKAVVTLPEGMTVNPSSANGRLGCSLADLGMSPSGEPNAAPPQCPDASKIGTVKLKTPALPGELEGEIYVAKQSENPFHSLLALYIVIDDPTTGAIAKIPGEIRADPATGQLTTIVDNSPQFPFEELRTEFFGGQKAALRTPAVCGKYTVTSSLTPWSAPESGPPATPSSTFKISQGCAESAAAEPNAPAFKVGTETPVAGAFSPLGLELSRADGSQELKGLNLTLPPGLIGKLAGLTECSDAQLATVTARSAPGQGALEKSSPSCPASSEVGSVTVGAGAGLTPYYATGHAYLAGPYKGAPLSLAVITPAVAGPFDLGDVLVRNALYVDPETAQITAKSDPLPTILQGIPLDVRSIALNMTRNQFTLNPTSCEKFAVTGSATSVLNQSAPLTSPFQVGGCKALGFKPKLALSLKGGTKRNKNPALTATLTYPKGSYANIASAQVTLPHSAFLDQAHIGTVCTRVQFAAHACPAASVYGKAIAYTPLLDKPLSGPVYLRSSSNKLPDLVADLNGQIEVTLDGKIDTGKGGGIRNTFTAVPDAPVSKFVLSLEGGKQGLLVNSENLCGPHAKTHAIADFTGQNGKVYDTTPEVQNSCPKKGGKKDHKGHKHNGSHK